MASKKKLKQRIKQLREVVKCERTERLALDRHSDGLLTLFNEECARNEKLKAELALYEDRDYDRWATYCHGWENGRRTAFASRLTVSHRILSDWTDEEKEKLRQRLVSNQSYKALINESHREESKPEGANGGWERLCQFNSAAKYRKEHLEEYPYKCPNCKRQFNLEEWSVETAYCKECAEKLMLAKYPLMARTIAN